MKTGRRIGRCEKRFSGKWVTARGLSLTRLWYEREFGVEIPKTFHRTSRIKKQITRRAVDVYRFGSTRFHLGDIHVELRRIVENAKRDADNAKILALPVENLA
jgi:hypothetical protein